MLRPAAPIVLTDQEREVLSQWARSGAGEHRFIERARVVLLADEGASTREIARRLHTRPARVSKWRQRFARQRLEQAPSLRSEHRETNSEVIGYRPALRLQPMEWRIVGQGSEGRQRRSSVAGLTQA